MKSISFYSLLLLGVLGFAIFSSYAPENKQTTQADQPSNDDRLPQRIHSIDLDQSFDFAGEALPMDNFDVRERLDMELLRNAYYHSSTILNLKRTTRYFPTIERILAEEGLPDDMKFLAVAESSLSNAVSPAGAKGFWQFMKGTAGDYKLEVSSQVDERYHLEKSTRAACKFLKRYKEKFGSWTLAAAAYNMGASRLSRDMEAQRMDSYYDLNLNQETSKYIFRIVALKEILKNPQKFGFELEAEDMYDTLGEYSTLEVTESIANLGDFARKYGTTYRMLKIYNPWLVNSSLSVRSGKTYEIKIPK